MVDSAPETVRLWNNVTKALALSKDRIANEPATVLRLRELLRVVADEPNIDKARALADAELKTPNVADKRRAEGESA